MAKEQKTQNIVTKKHISRQDRENKQTKTITIISIGTGVIVLGLVLFGLVNQFLIRPQTTIATVGETKIKAGEFESFVQYSRVQLINQAYQYYNLQQQFGQFGGDFLQPAIGIVTQLTQPIPFAREVLDEMINNIIIREEAERLGISVSQEEIDQAIYSAFGFFPKGTLTPTVTATILPSPTYSETQLSLAGITSTPNQPAENVENLNSAENNIGLNQAPEDPANDIEIDLANTSEEPESIIGEEENNIEATPTITVTPTPYTTQVFGQNIKDFNKAYRLYNFDIQHLREIFKTKLLSEKIVEQITQDIPTTKDEVWARHILVETQEEALEIIDKLNEGGDFKSLARLYSTDESNKENGGDLGWFDENTMVPSFSKAAFSLQEGEISQPVESSFGYHIIQVIGKRVSQIMPAELQQIQQVYLESWLSDKRAARNDIVINPDWEKYAPSKPEVPQDFVAALLSQGQ